MSDHFLLCDGFQQRFDDDPEPAAYLSRRIPGGRISYLIATFGCGLSPSTWGAQANFSSRITFPLWVDQTIVGFRGVTWREGDSRPKAVPWPRVAQSIANPFGVCPATRPVFERLRFAVVVEGELDALTLWSLGIPAVASLMPQLGEDQCRCLAGLADCVVVWADNDLNGTGWRGAAKTSERLRSYGVSVVQTMFNVPGVKDVNDVYTLMGPAAVTHFLSSTVKSAG